MKIGLITNPQSKKNRKDNCIEKRLEEILGNELFAIPENEEDYSSAIRGLIRNGADCIAVNGGDGTVHRTLTALKNIFAGQTPILPLGSGTFNIYLNSLGIKTGIFGPNPRRILEKALKTEKPDIVERKILCIYEGRAPKYGYSFAAGLCEKFMEQYQKDTEYGRLRFFKEVFKTMYSLMFHNIFKSAEAHYNKIVDERNLNVYVNQELIPQKIWSTALAVSMELKFDFKLFTGIAYKGLNELENKIAFLGGEVNIWRAFANVHRGILKMDWNIKNFYDKYAKEIVINQARGMEYIIDGEGYKCRQDEIAIFPANARFLKV